MSEELKPKSFRITDETAEKFKEISANIGGNQQTALAKLIEAFEFQACKAVLTEKKPDIDKFENYVSLLTSMYMQSLEDNQNLSETVRIEFESLLRSKDSTIEDLQSQLKASRDAEKIASTTAKEKIDETIELSKTIEDFKLELQEKTEGYKKSVADKESLITALKDSVTELRLKNETMLTEHNRFAEMKNALEESIAAKKNCEAHINDLSAELEHLAKQHKEELQFLSDKSQVEHDRAMLTLKMEYQAKFDLEKEKHQEEISKYQDKYLGLLEQIEGRA